MNKLTNFDMNDLRQLVYKELSIAELQDMIARRNQLIKYDVKAPKYLLEPEIKQFFDYVDNYDDLMLFKTLWITGARITETLMLAPENYSFGVNSCLLMMPNLKQKIKIKKGVYTTQGIKQIQITNKDYINDIKRYIITKKISENEKIFKYTRYQADYIIQKVQANALKNDIQFPFKISCHTFRHSCAMNLVYNNVDEKVIQKYLGHSRIENTRIYTNLFHLEKDISHVKF